jgi:hypothetical protein
MTTSPMDLMDVYLTASMGVGQRLALATIDARVKRLPLRRTLLMISEICFLAEQASSRDPQPRRELAGRILPSPFLPAVDRVMATPGLRVHPVSPQILVHLGLRVLALSPATDGAGLSDDALAKEVGALCLALGDHVHSAGLDAETTTLEVLRLGLFYGVAEHGGWLSLTARLFLDVLPTMQSHPDWIDVAHVFEAQSVVKLDRYWAITAIQGMIAVHDSTSFILPMNVDGYQIPEGELSAWSSTMSSSLAEAGRAAAIDLLRPIGWSMGAVWERPIVDLGDGRGPVLRPRLLQAHAEPAHMFWHVRHALVAAGVEHEQCSRLYGAVVERLGLDLLHECVGQSLVLDEDEMTHRWSIPKGAKRGDAAVIQPDGDLVVIDFVARQFTRETTSTGDFSALASDLRKAVVDKAEQIDSTLAFALKAGEPHRRIYPVVVVAGPFPLSPPLVGWIADAVKKRQLEVIGGHPDCSELVVLDLLNFHLLLRLSERCSLPLTALAQQWLDSSLGANSFRDWATTDGPARDVPGGGQADDWHARLRTILGLPIPPLGAGND